MAELPTPNRLRGTLEQAAARPQGTLDTGDIARRARRIRRNQRLTTAAVVVAFLVPATLAGSSFLTPETAIDFAAGGGKFVQTPALSPTPSPTPTSTPTPSVPQAPGVVSEGPGLAQPSAAPSPKPQKSSSATVVISDPPGAPERRPDLSGDPRHPDIVLTLLVERTDVRQGQRWSGWLEARNTGNDAVALGDAPCWALWGLYRDGKWVGGQSDSTCDTEHARATLKPGETVRVPLAFDTVAGDVRGDKQAQLEPGRYQAAAALRVRTDRHDYAGVWYAPTVTMTVRAAAAAASEN